MRGALFWNPSTLTPSTSRWISPPAAWGPILFAGLFRLLVRGGWSRALAGGVTPGDAAGFPVTLSLPGTYRLSGNLTVPDANTNGIEVKANNVVIDLNGFSILGPTVCPIGSTTTSNNGETIVTACSPTGSGIGVKAGDPYTISSTGPVANGQVGVRVINGNISGMGSHGVVLGPAGRVENLTAQSNGGNGVMSGRGSIVRNNIGIGNGGIGFFVGNASIIQGNTATLNMGIGFEVGSGLTFDAFLTMWRGKTAVLLESCSSEIRRPTCSPTTPRSRRRALESVRMA